jgi:hypothetical protein
MPVKPTPKQKAKTMIETKAKREEFVRAYIDNDFKNAAAVYEKVYGCSAKSAISAASRLLKDVNIQEMMATELAETMKIARIPLEKRVVDTWMRRAFYDPADILDADGSLVDTMANLSKAGLSVCIDGIDVKPDKDSGEHYVYKLADRDKALEMLQKYAQIIKPFDARVSGSDNAGAFVVEFLKSGEK